MKQIMQLANAVALDSGAGLAFDLVAGNETVTYAVPTPDLGKIIQFFASAATVLNGDQDGSASDDLFPVPIKGMGLQPGATPDTTVLVLNIGVFLLGFEADATALAENLQTAARIATTLSAGNGGAAN